MEGRECSGDYDETVEEFNPRIKEELESLNQAASDVNRLEKEINEARSKYNETFYECSQALETLRKKYGKKINKARSYYETKELSKVAQSEAMLSARKFQSANGVYMAAKETISLAELRLKDDKAACLSPAWQEMLNHALLRVTESEHEKTKSEKEHLEKSAIFSSTEKRLQLLEKKHKKAIAKSKPYFDAKNELELKLQQIKQSIEDLQQAMHSAKGQYSRSLKNLEDISDGIHEARREKLILMYPREPGVGAEEEPCSTVTELPSLSSPALDMCNTTDDERYDDDDNEDEEEEDLDDDSETDSLANDIQHASPIKYNKNNTTSPSKTTDTNLISQDQGIVVYENIDYPKLCHQQNTSNTSTTTTSTSTSRILGVKQGKQSRLRKSMSLPAYYVEEEEEKEKLEENGGDGKGIGNNNNIQSFQVETDNVILNVESGSGTRAQVEKSCYESESSHRGIVIQQDRENSENQTGNRRHYAKTSNQILDPTALLSTSVLGGAINKQF